MLKMQQNLSLFIFTLIYESREGLELQNSIMSSSQQQQQLAGAASCSSSSQQNSAELACNQSGLYQLESDDIMVKDGAGKDTRDENAPQSIVRQESDAKVSTPNGEMVDGMKDESDNTRTPADEAKDQTYSGEQSVPQPQDNSQREQNLHEEQKAQPFSSSISPGAEIRRQATSRLSIHEDSLVALVNSELFTVHMLFQHLQRQLNDGKALHVEHLINGKLKSESIYNIDFYLPQICYLVLSKSSAGVSVEKFLLETAVKHRNIGLKALQLFQSFSEDSGAIYQERAMDFYNEMEQSLVNGEIPKKYGFDIAKEFNFDEFNDKKYKADYLSLQIKFFDQLKYLSIKLKNLPLIERMSHLKRKLEEINEWIKQNVRSQVDTITTQSKYNYNGVVLPFELGDDQDQSIILNIVPDLALAFDTKKRAPFRVVFETVKLSELRDGLFQQSETRPADEEAENFRGAGKTVNLDDREERPQMIVEQETQAQEAIIDNQLEEMNIVSFTQGDEEENGHQLENPFASSTFRALEGEAEHGSDPVKQNQDQELEFTEDIRFDDNMMFSSQPSPFIEQTHQFHHSSSMKIQSTDKALIMHEESKSDNQAILIRNVVQDKPEESFIQVNLLIEKMANNRRSSSIGMSPSHNQESEEYLRLQARIASLEGMDDPFKENWVQVQRNIRTQSEFSVHQSYNLKMMIVKANDDLRQENLAMQLMKRLHMIFEDAGLKNSIYLRPYDIFITSSNSGMIEFVPDTISIDSLKKKFPKTLGTQTSTWTLATFYKKYFGDYFEEAQKNFVESLAGYSLYNYLFNVKDRHNANIMIDSTGRLIHIDYGFIFQNAPGGISFEGAPFKLTQEYIDLMDGMESEMFVYFKSLMIRGFFEIRKNLDDILVLIEILMKDSRMPCFVKPKTLLSEIRDRMSLKYNSGLSKESDYFELVDRLVKSSANNWRTTQYDLFQKMTNGIEK